MRTDAIPMFHFGSRSNGSNPAAILGLVSGLLLLDSGEVESTFLFRCQDRYLTYSALSGIRPILLVQDGQHWEHYKRLLEDLSSRLQTISQKVGISLPQMQTPLAFPIDLEALEIVDLPFFRQQLYDPEIQNSLRLGALVFNQVSPTCARLVGQMDALLSKYGFGFGIDIMELERVGTLALRWHNKAHYVRRTRHLNGQIPAHAATALLTPREFLATQSWEELCRLVRNGVKARSGGENPAAVYVKSSLDSGGNVAARVCACNFEDEIQRLKTEVRRRVLGQDIDERADLESLQRDIGIAPSLKCTPFSDKQLNKLLKAQRRRRNNIGMLVQEAVGCPASADPRFEGIGVTCEVSPDRVEILPAGQLFADPERRHYLGSYLGPDLSVEGIPARLLDQLRNLCGLAAEEGYRGPLNFDARINADGEWIFVYDCNPRLSAIYPVIATKYWLLGQGLPVDTIVNLGYRGEYACEAALEETLRKLDDRKWLYTRWHPRGALPLPNLARTNGLDLVLVNLNRQEIEEFVRFAADLRFDRSADACLSAVY